MPVLECAETEAEESRFESLTQELNRSSWSQLLLEDSTGTATTVGEIALGMMRTFKLWCDTTATNNIWKQLAPIELATPYTSVSESKLWYLDYKSTCTNTISDYLRPWSEWIIQADSGIYRHAEPTQPVRTPETPQILVHKDSPAARQARERARTLLRSILTPDQWREYERDGTITISSQSGQRYQLNNKGRVRNITRLNQGNVAVEYLCCHPVDDVPIEDVLIAQKLHLECAEESFRKTANITPIVLMPSAQPSRIAA